MRRGQVRLSETQKTSIDQGDAGDVQKSDTQLEYGYVLSNAELPGILYGRGVRFIDCAP